MLSFLLCPLAASVPIANATSDDHISFSSGVTLFSPLNQTYNTRYLSLDFSFACGLGMHYSLSFDIDGKYAGPMPYVVKNPNELHVVYQSSGSVTLPELSEGSHSLTVNLLVSPSNDHIKPSYSNTVYFSIDLTPPNVTILSPANQTYTVANITEASFPLDFTVDKIISQVLLGLDGQNDMAIDGNTTLTGLSLGLHNVTVKAVDLAGRVGASDTVNFTIAAEPEPKSDSEPELFPIVPVATASAAVLALAGAGFFVYHKHKTRQFSKETLTGFSQGSCTRSLITKTLPTIDWWQ
jgi:hypothetical protein